MVENLAAMQETWVWSLGWEYLLEKGMATQSSIVAWRIPWTEGPGRIQSMRAAQTMRTKFGLSLERAGGCMTHPLTFFKFLHKYPLFGEDHPESPLNKSNTLPHLNSEFPYPVQHFFFLFPLHLLPSVSVGCCWITNHSQTWLKTVISSLTVLGVDGTWFGGSCLGSLFCSCCRILVDASGIWRFYWAGHPRWFLTPLQLRLTWWGTQLVLSSRASSCGLSTWLR